MSSPTTPTVGPLGHSGAHNVADLVRITRALRLRAAAEVRAAFPDDLKRYALPGMPRTTISRARMGSSCSPAFRFGLLFVALRSGGATRDRAQRLVDAAQDLVNLLWGSETAPAGSPVLLTVLQELREERNTLNRVIPMLERQALKEAA